jgi:hypothetical protein
MVTYNTTTTVGGASFAIYPVRDQKGTIKVEPAEDGDKLKIILRNFTGSINIKELAEKRAPVKAVNASTPKMTPKTTPKTTPKPLRKARDSILSPFSEDEAPKMTVPDEDSEVDDELDGEYESTQQNGFNEAEFVKNFIGYS